MKQTLQNKRIFLFDIDGTLAVDKTLLPGAAELLTYIRETGKKAFYITNNSAKSRKDYVEQFYRQWNLETTEEQFVTASYAAVLYLQQYYNRKKLFVLGTASFLKELEQAGLTVTDRYEADAACVVVGFDQELRYQKLMDACRLLSDPDVDFIATNPDLRCPASFGFIPDCGSICHMLSNTVDRIPYYVGKPNRVIVDLCLKEAGGKPEDVLVVGDRLYTDIACGIQAGVDTAVVFTGEAVPEDMEGTEYPAAYEFPSVKELYYEINPAAYSVEGEETAEESAVEGEEAAEDSAAEDLAAVCPAAADRRGI